MKEFSFISSGILITALFVFAQSGEQARDSFKLSTYFFEIRENQGNCMLFYSEKGKKKELKLDVPLPCKVVRRSMKNDVIHHRYNDINAIVFMVGGSLKKGRCKGETASSYQTVLVKRTQVVLGAKSNNITCLPDGPDGKEYWLLSH